jgi:hypothetical protein
MNLLLLKNYLRKSPLDGYTNQQLPDPNSLCSAWNVRGEASLFRQLEVSRRAFLRLYWREAPVPFYRWSGKMIRALSRTSIGIQRNPGHPLLKFPWPLPTTLSFTACRQCGGHVFDFALAFPFLIVSCGPRQSFLVEFDYNLRALNASRTGTRYICQG